jgi:6-phosphogluconolactonase (cycloisomerase 2 family)
MNLVPFSVASALALIASLTACGGGGGGGSSAPATYSVGGTVSGSAAGQRIVLRNNGGDSVTVDGSGSFTFPTRMTGGAYNVTLDAANSDRNCVIENGAGTVSGANVTSVSVRCGSVFAFVANNAANTVSQYIIGANGELTPNGTVTAADTPQHVAVHGSGRYAYVATAAGSIRQYTVGTNGILTAMGTASVPAGGSGYVVRVVVHGNYAYATNWTAGRIYQYTIGADGALTPMTPAYVGSATNPSAMVINGNCNCAIVGDDAANGQLYVFDVSPTDGSLSFRAAYAANFRTKDIALYAARDQFWVAGGNENAIQRWTVSSAGNLAYAGNVGLNAAWALALGNNGEVLWAANRSDNLVRPYQVDIGTGALNPVAPDASIDINGPVSIATDGDYVYVANATANTVSMYSVSNATTGALTLLPSSTVATGTTPNSIALY